MDELRIFAFDDPDCPKSEALRERLRREGRLAPERCKCGQPLSYAGDHDLKKGLCRACIEAAHKAELEAAIRKAAELTAAEKSLIRQLHGLLPARQLLDVLNERRNCQAGRAPKVTMEQLHSEINESGSAPPAGGHSWASLRRVLGEARRDGRLDRISEQVIDDFAVVFSLNARQLLNLKDIILQAREAG